MTVGDPEALTIGEIGGTNTNNNFYINGNGVNNIVIDSGIGSLLLYAKKSLLIMVELDQ